MKPGEHKTAQARMHDPCRLTRRLISLLTCGVAAVLWFVADAGWREFLIVPVLAAAGLLAWPVLLPLMRERAGLRWMLAGALLAGMATWCGGIGSGGPWLQVTTGSIGWALAVLGIGGMMGVAAESAAVMWSRVVAAMFALIVAASLAGYLIGAERWMLVEWTWWGALFKRLASVWPCRWWAGAEQRIWWEHPNTGAWIFACGLGISLEAAWRRSTLGWRKMWPLLLLVAGATCALFLTASRSGYLVAIILVPLVAIGRPWRWAAMVLLGLSVGFGFGWWMLANKVPPVVPPGVESGDLHGPGLVARRDAGRLEGYRRWADVEMQGHWWCGQGVAATGKPMPGGLPHEHSMYVATVRGGGLVALGGQLLLLGCAGWAALAVARVGRRGPLLLWAAVVVGFLFDRSTVFRASANLEFLTHWAAVWWAWIAMRQGRERQTRACHDEIGSTPHADDGRRRSGGVVQGREVAGA